MVDYAVKGCPSCQGLILNGKQRYSCRANFSQCDGNKKCPFKNRVVDVLTYMDNSNDIAEIKEAMRDVLKYLREKK